MTNQKLVGGIPVESLINTEGPSCSNEKALEHGKLHGKLQTEHLLEGAKLWSPEETYAKDNQAYQEHIQMLADGYGTHKSANEVVEFIAVRFDVSHNEVLQWIEATMFEFANASLCYHSEEQAFSFASGFLKGATVTAAKYIVQAELESKKVVDESEMFD